MFWSNIKHRHNNKIYEEILKFNDILSSDYEKVQNLKEIK